VLGFQFIFFWSQPQFLEFGWWFLNAWCGQTGRADLSSESPLWLKDLLAPGADMVGCQGFCGGRSGLLPFTQLEIAGEPLWFFFYPPQLDVSQKHDACAFWGSWGVLFCCADWWFRFWWPVSPLHCTSVKRPDFYHECHSVREEHLCAVCMKYTQIVVWLLFQC